MAIRSNIIEDGVANCHNILFLAPSKVYARSVVHNLKSDLDKKGILNKSSNPSSWDEPYLKTNKVHVTFLYCDPIEYPRYTHLFAEAAAVFGKLELFGAIPDNVRRYVRRADTSLVRYISDAENPVAYPTNDTTPKTAYLPEISKVHFNPPMTIVLWEDGTKTTVKCQEDDAYSDEVGLALCIAKKALGNKGNFNNVFRKWVPDREIDIQSIVPDSLLIRLATRMFPTYPSAARNIHHNNKEGDFLND